MYWSNDSNFTKYGDPSKIGDFHSPSWTGKRTMVMIFPLYRFKSITHDQLQNYRLDRLHHDQIASLLFHYKENIVRGGDQPTDPRTFSTFSGKHHTDFKVQTIKKHFDLS